MGTEVRGDKALGHIKLMQVEMQQMQHVYTSARGADE